MVLFLLAAGCAAPPALEIERSFARLQESPGEGTTRAFLSHGAAAARHLLSLPVEQRHLVVQHRDTARPAAAPPDGDYVIVGYLVQADEREWVLAWYPWGGPLRPDWEPQRTVVPVGAIRIVTVAPAESRAAGDLAWRELAVHAQPLSQAPGGKDALQAAADDALRPIERKALQEFRRRRVQALAPKHICVHPRSSAVPRYSAVSVT